MKPSERIKEILKTPDSNGMFTSETGAILEYLDEEWEKKQGDDDLFEDYNGCGGMV